MHIITLIENTPGNNNELINEHGLSIYIETEKHKILADTGATDSFIKNAEKLNINLKDIDIVFLSHGHYDHTDGLLKFSEINNKALIYMQKTAAGDFYHGDKYIGINKNILTLPNLRLIDGNFKIDDELEIFSKITGRKYYPESNLVLTERKNEKEIQDSFTHEQCLVICAENKKILISGCAHNGILNILDIYREIYNNTPNIIISGFHMKKSSPYTKEETEIIKNTAIILKDMNTVFYTGHCTNEPAVNILAGIMKNNLKIIHTGEKII